MGDHQALYLILFKRKTNSEEVSNLIPKSWVNPFWKNANFLTMLKCHNNSLGRLLFCVDHRQISYQVPFCKKWYFYSLESLLFIMKHHTWVFFRKKQTQFEKYQIFDLSHGWIPYFSIMLKWPFYSLERLFFSPEHHRLSYLSPFPKKQGNFYFWTKIMIQPSGKMHIILLCQNDIFIVQKAFCFN